MLHCRDDTNSEIIHYRAQTVPELLDTPHKGHWAFNPRLGKQSKRVTFLGCTAQEIPINPQTGGYDL